jgi:hypothetical protein
MLIADDVKTMLAMVSRDHPLLRSGGPRHQGCRVRQTRHRHHLDADARALLESRPRRRCRWCWCRRGNCGSKQLPHSHVWSRCPRSAALSVKAG